MEQFILHPAVTTHAIPTTNTGKWFGENLTYSRERTSFDLRILHHIKDTEGASENK
jgi:hypothetical protein